MATALRVKVPARRSLRLRRIDEVLAARADGEQRRREEPTSVETENLALSESRRVDLDGLSHIPTFTKEPYPPQFPPESRQFASSVPTDLRLERQPPLPDIHVPPTPVSLYVRLVLVPRLLVNDCNVQTIDDFDTYVDIPNDKFVDISIANSKFNRLVLTHALYGFAFDTIKVAMWTLNDEDDRLQPRPKNVSTLRAEDAIVGMPLKPSDSSAQRGSESRATDSDTENLLPFYQQAASLYRAVVCLNLQAISNALNHPSVWTFCLRVESSPYFGQGGVHAKICFQSPDGRLRHAHLQGIKHPPTDIPNLVMILKSLCPKFTRKLAGVAANLSPMEHEGLQGAITSRLVATFAREVARGPKLCTPDDMIGELPPLLPWKIVLMLDDEMTALVRHYQPRVEFACGMDHVERILAEHKKLREKVMMKDFDSCDDQNWEAFESCWAPYSKEFSALFRFFGGLASMFWFTRVRPTLVSITSLEGLGHSERDNHVAAEGILQARQFIQLRELFVPTSSMEDRVASF